MKTIRKNVFETNSSSCHCVTVCGQDKLERFLNNELVCIYPFDYADDYQNYEFFVSDDYFITVEASYIALKTRYDSLDRLPLRSKYSLETIKSLFEYEKEFTLEAYKQVLFSLDDTEFNGIDRYQLKEFFEQEIYTAFSFNDGENSTPLVPEQKNDLSGIEGPRTVISKTIYC